ncbi:endolytic transglycosylase MltG [Clostridium celatum]|uniref:Endolytic murein transglycosylase n=1 Tax=Clostridium celatum DSM 1785 TaxID=545697 RepID=L1QG62_9CLOT|nr:endolytic transglycosylase MltG [Clostridium celatum]EKY26670.1 YceG family protein [Clostridium celatum DSM 1785]MCE9653787.1 endolytic transglycosylase MltG [Clostridium celatum]MDU3723034.1 endolytic transglycosylase MltG [Clostridium celatum]MDU6295716.1 endolytic transglycosylase MltG [Clostridium celatum]MDY3360565.1 endolytic transglycosylase MltG [Clostridium celatum]
MKKKSKTITMVIAIFAICIVAFIGVRYISVVNKPLLISQDEEVIVSEGDSFYSIINKLFQEKKIKSPIMIKVYSKLTNANLEVLPGKHTLTKGMNLKEVIEDLGSKSEGEGILLTIPEGFTIEDIAFKLEELGICSSDEFLTAVKEYPLPSYITNNPDKRYNLEGFLFPDTYNFDLNVTPEYIIQTMLDRFKEVWDENTKGMDIKDEDIEKVVNVASIIEKEARVDEDRPLIASVIYNRLNIDMPLQIDATVIYAHGYYIESVRNRHLAIESKYNTYLYKGLPVGPISNPGEKSLAAALHPADTDYLFYILEKDGEHYFTNNYDDFETKKEELGY